MNSLTLSKKFAQSLDQAISDGQNPEKAVDNLIALLPGTDKEKLIERIMISYQEIQNQKEGYKVVYICSQTSPSDNLINTIKNKLSSKYPKVEIKSIIDENLIGGVKIKIDDLVIDGTIKNILHNFKE